MQYWFICMLWILGVSTAAIELRGSTSVTNNRLPRRGLEEVMATLKASIAPILTCKEPAYRLRDDKDNSLSATANSIESTKIASVQRHNTIDVFGKDPLLKDADFVAILTSNDPRDFKAAKILKSYRTVALTHLKIDPGEKYMVTARGQFGRRPPLDRQGIEKSLHEMNDELDRMHNLEQSKRLIQALVSANDRKAIAELVKTTAAVRERAGVELKDRKINLKPAGTIRT
ncbi:hypothetical protein FRB97_003066 [Tulasnella sp. 331]|nr:hypothetical protein FRB97_003066 [Tulasnella sp. 331]